MCDPNNKPPLGILPRKLHRQNRALEIVDAMHRYVYADKPIPKEWLEELDELAGSA